MPRVIPALSQYLDGEGDPLSEGFLKFNVSGTNATDKDTFADISETIANTNPVPLDADGRAPNIFGTGSYRVTMYDYNMQQIDQKDPVPGDTAATSQWGAWSAVVTYPIDWYLLDGEGDIYKSLQNSNENNEPSVSPTFWERVNFIQVYNTNIDYNAGTIMLFTDGYAYYTAAGTSAGETPVTDPSKWERLNSDVSVTTVITSSGDWTKPDGLLYAKVTIVGGGGGGGAVDGQGAGTWGAGAGGAGGGWCSKIYAASDLSTTEAVVIGASGPGGDGDGDTTGSAGGDTTFKAMTAEGGAGGPGGNAISGPQLKINSSPLGGNSGGDIGGEGGPGGPGMAFAASTVGVASGMGGSSLMGGGGRPIYNTSGSTSESYGAGGSGASVHTAATNYNGGIGLQGVCIVEEFF